MAVWECREIFRLVLKDQGLRFQEENIYDQDGGTIFREPKGWEVDLLLRTESKGCNHPPYSKDGHPEFCDGLFFHE
jgi:hypothetical protein